jgi:carbon-monoxide dehydrogenase large subunit
MNAKPDSFIGRAVERREDYRFLTGNGQYTDDIVLPNQSYACFLRSPHAHARIRRIDTQAALGAPGVLGVFTGQDVAAVGGLPCGWLITSIDGTPMKEPKHPIIAETKVCHVGDQVALVVAETLAEAKAAAALIDVDYEFLPAVVDTSGAAKSGTTTTTSRRITSATPGPSATRRPSMRPLRGPRTSPSCPL